jgi:hypothetical protein
MENWIWEFRGIIFTGIDRIYRINIQVHTENTKDTEKG